MEEAASMYYSLMLSKDRTTGRFDLLRHGRLALMGVPPFQWVTLFPNNHCREITLGKLYSGQPRSAYNSILG